METSLTLVILSCLLLGVSGSCNLEECKREVYDNINNSNYCNSTSMQDNAVKALTKCVYSDGETKQACPFDVRNKTSSIAKEIDEKCYGSRLTLPGSCDASGLFLCVTGLAGLPSLGNIKSFRDVASTCVEVKKLLNTLNICKSCIGSLFGNAWQQVQQDVDKFWGMATDFANGACDCAVKIEDAIKTVDETSTCAYIESVSKSIENIAQKCVFDLVDSIHTFNWTKIAEDSLKLIAAFTDNACAFTRTPQPSKSTPSPRETPPAELVRPSTNGWTRNPTTRSRPNDDHDDINAIPPATPQSVSGKGGGLGGGAIAGIVIGVVIAVCLIVVAVLLFFTFRDGGRSRPDALKKIYEKY